MGTHLTFFLKSETAAFQITAHAGRHICSVRHWVQKELKSRDSEYYTGVAVLHRPVSAYSLTLMSQSNMLRPISTCSCKPIVFSGLQSAA